VFPVSPEVDAVLDSAAADLAYVVYAVAGVLAVPALRRRRVRPVVQLGAAPLVAYGLARCLAHLGQHRTVPAATAAFAIAYAIFLFFDRRVGVALAAGAVVAGLNHPDDLAVAAAIASLAVFVVHVGGSLAAREQAQEHAHDGAEVRLPGPGGAG
jgi:undecaprenyl-diphosphatase